MLLRRRRTGCQCIAGRTNAGHVQRYVQGVHRAGGYLQFVQIAQVVVAVVQVIGVIGGEERILVQPLIVAVLLIVVEAKCQLIVAGHQVAGRSAMIYKLFG